MKKSTFALLVLSLVTLGLTACKKHQVTYVETSYLTVHPAARKGDTLNFPIPAAGKIAKGTQYYVHFIPGSSPCSDETIPMQAGGQLQCDVTADPQTPTRYYFYIDASLAPQSSPRCPPWCSGMVVVGPSGPVEEPQVLVPLSPGSIPAAEVLIYNNSADAPVADPTPVVPGQPVTWVTNGSLDTPWSITFTPNICLETQPIVWDPKKVVYCTVNPNTAQGTYTYTITVGTTHGTGTLNVGAAPSPSSSKPQ